MRVYVRAKERYLTNERKKTLLETYDDTIMPPYVENAGRASYVKRNQAMIDVSAYCIFYYDPTYQLIKNSKSGTRIAFEYANQRSKKVKEMVVINVFKNISM